MMKTLFQCKHGHLERTLEIENFALEHEATIQRSCSHCGDPIMAVVKYSV